MWTVTAGYGKRCEGEHCSTSTGPDAVWMYDAEDECKLCVDVHKFT